MQIRIKAGGPSSVISIVDAKKLGLKISAPPVVKPDNKKIVPGVKLKTAG